MNLLKRIVCLAIVAGISLSLCGCNSNNANAAEKAVSARVSIDGNKFKVNGNEFWINGVNTPWQNRNDFNGNMDESFWDNEFKRLSDDNINCTRIWINCAGESIVRLKSSGEIKSVNENHCAYS